MFLELLSIGPGVQRWNTAVFMGANDSLLEAENDAAVVHVRALVQTSVRWARSERLRLRCFFFFFVSTLRQSFVGKMKMHGASRRAAACLFSASGLAPLRRFHQSSRCQAGAHREREREMSLIKTWPG